MVKNKIGIMGGTFNPIHFGHLILAENAYEQFNLEYVYFIPSKNPPHKLKQNIADDALRFNMTKIAIQDNPHFKISSLELDREGFTYTVDTLCELSSLHPKCELYFIMGADSLFQIEKWRDTKEILKRCHILAARRDDKEDKDVLEQIAYLKQKYESDIQLLKVPKIEISSHMIRECIKKGRTVKYYLPACVEKYIIEKKIYFND